MLKSLGLVNFRNIKKKEIVFSPQITVIVGPNASGKTNILEGVYLISSGKSFRARMEEEMIRYEADIARVVAKIKVENLESNEDIQDTGLEVILTRGEIAVGDSRIERTPRKKLLVNGVPRRLIDFAGQAPMVLFGPQDLDLVTQNPNLRRKFLDMVLSQVDREYRRAILSYEKGIRQRNRLLFRIREEGLSRSQLLFWDRLLIKNGDFISTKREEFIEFANSTKGLNDQIFKLEYDKSAISEVRLEQYAAEEVAAATTLVGPHRDDFAFKVKSKKQEVKEKDLATYGSRGEARMGVLWLKLAELSFVEKVTGELPTLLLDDIFSELDHEHRSVVMKAVERRQSIITTADPHYIEGIKKVEKITLTG
jgi:DNA replication and repair protein RecF